MNDTGLLLKKISNKLECNRNRALKELGLTATQLDLLYYLYTHQEQENTLSDITAFFGIQHTSAIHVLKILEEKGYIYKEPTKRNPRFKNICLTDKGLPLMEEFDANIAVVHQQLLSGITETERAELDRLLNIIYDNLGKI
ncbi:MAG: MarR family transcriptional regulator [Lachnospiraceae bacterium]|nr:MarR family transcriptional regulator [Lachnospiraceae bacterium]